MRALDARWVTYLCVECALESGAIVRPGYMAKFYTGACRICCMRRPVTEPSAYRWNPETENERLASKGN